MDVKKCVIYEAFSVRTAALRSFRRRSGESLSSFNPSAIARSMGVCGSLPGTASGKIVHHLLAECFDGAATIRD
ncbi:hypothetical protein [Xanthomonas arboricola]|uniref:hypothetical protein n=1 Tax=Xanthomonas arboricola TaxID=56448 RepID=UPI001C61506E|nr:hypothetical protein [Xanthomonas arboricola]